MYSSSNDICILNSFRMPNIFNIIWKRILEMSVLDENEHIGRIICHLLVKRGNVSQMFFSSSETVQKYAVHAT